MNTTAPFWHALKGAAKYVAAIATGDIATPETQERRAKLCAGCPDRNRYTALGMYVWTCGTAGVDRKDANPPTCGCIVLSGSRNQTSAEAAGKTVVASERCPQGRWGSSSRLNTAQQEAS